MTAADPERARARRLRRLANRHEAALAALAVARERLAAIDAEIAAAAEAVAP